MKFLEVKTASGTKLFINVDKIVAFKTQEANGFINEAFAITLDNSEYLITKDEYNRITQSIDKVDHL